jgi:hypothetical protein
VRQLFNELAVGRLARTENILGRSGIILFTMAHFTGHCSRRESRETSTFYRG